MGMGMGTGRLSSEIVVSSERNEDTPGLSTSFVVG